MRRCSISWLTFIITINGQALTPHVGGYLPFEYEITSQLAQKENVLAVAVDGRWLNALPDGSPRGAGAVDFFEPAGITRPVSLRVLPQVFINDVFAKPVNVLAADCRVEISGTIDAGKIPLPIQGEDAVFTVNSLFCEIYSLCHCGGSGLNCR